ncbi:MAG TPA: dethiobiotin synthase [Usitatibacter sp.]|jgi:dethiobiotin synthetase|nr:dethiobiotin synthase [Usitatibacter sp.]
MTRGAFVTGTDTGVGKTFASCVLLKAALAQGLRAMPMKPVAAGSDEDTLALLAAAGFGKELAADVTPVLLREAIAPHIAAAHEGRRVDLASLHRAYERLAARADFMVVEGVGGFAVPLGASVDTIDLARSFGLPVVLVVGMRLGCLNHALLTQSAILHAGLPLAGWIANAIDPRMTAADENVDALRERIRAPLLGRLPNAPGCDPAILAPRLDLKPLL